MFDVVDAIGAARDEVDASTAINDVRFIWREGSGHRFSYGLRVPAGSSVEFVVNTNGVAAVNGAVS